MPKTISQILAEADEIIEKRAATKTVEDEISEDVMKIAEQLQNFSAEEDNSEDPLGTSVEKIAHALAVVEVFANLPYIQKAAAFSDMAEEAGYESDRIIACLEKAASKAGYVSLSELIPWL